MDARKLNAAVLADLMRDPRLGKLSDDAFAKLRGVGKSVARAARQRAGFSRDSQRKRLDDERQELAYDDLSSAIRYALRLVKRGQSEYAASVQAAADFGCTIAAVSEGMRAREHVAVQKIVGRSKGAA